MPKARPRPQASVYVLNTDEAALYAPAKVLILRPSGDIADPAAVLDVYDANGTLLRRVLVNGIPVTSRTLPLLIEPRGEGYHGGPPASESTITAREHFGDVRLKVAD